MSDDEIIRIKKAAKPSDPTKLWSDTLAFARALLKAYDERRGAVVVTKNQAGQIVAVTRQDEEGRILSVIAEAQVASAGAGAEVERLRGLLGEAADDLEEWGAYAPAYFQKKHDLKGAVRRYRTATVRPSSGS